jgi:hypothetical protein
MRSNKQIATVAADIAALKEQLGHVITMLATLVSAVNDGERGSFTIPTGDGACEIPSR